MLSAGIEVRLMRAHTLRSERCSVFWAKKAEGLGETKKSEDMDNMIRILKINAHRSVAGHESLVSFVVEIREQY